jgi:hypothetical protein
MSRTTPHVIDGFLRDAEGKALAEIDSTEWFAWLKDEAHHTFHFTYSGGGFTARKERKQRGDCYWVAYRQFHNKLHKTYLGKSETLTQAHLCAISSTLAALITCFEQELLDAQD